MVNGELYYYRLLKEAIDDEYFVAEYLPRSLSDLTSTKVRIEKTQYNNRNIIYEGTMIWRICHLDGTLIKPYNLNKLIYDTLKSDIDKLLNQIQKKHPLKLTV